MRSTIGGRLKLIRVRRLAIQTAAIVLSVMTLAVSIAKADDVKDNTPATDANTSAAKLPNAPVTREDIDQEITNAHLRASTGAKSLLSLQSTFNYNGSSIDHPLASQRPALSPGTIENDPAKLSGLISAKYRMTDHDNLNLGVGVGWLTPTYQGQKGQVEDPYATYSRVFKAGNVQNVFNVGFTYYTAQSTVASGNIGESDIDHTFLVGVGKTKLQLGIDIAWTRDFYQTGRNGIQDELAAFPFVEYEFSDRYSFRTVYRGLTYFNQTSSTDTFVRDAVTQSMGIGISVARDIYLYPNIQWVWTDIRSDKTNIALSANINL